MMTRWMPAAKDGFQVGQTAKARSGYRVQSLLKGRDRQCGLYLTNTSPLDWSKSHVSWTLRTQVLPFRIGIHYIDRVVGGPSRCYPVGRRTLPNLPRG